MEASFLTINGIDIAYFVKNREALTTIFFIHGNSSCSNAWRKQINDPLLQDYRLITIDLPAHGMSGEASDTTAYSLPGLAAIMSGTIKQLSNHHPYIIAGNSLGSNIVTEMLPFGVLPVGLLLAGPCIVGESRPVERIIKPGTQVAVVFTDNPDMENVKKYCVEASSSNDENDLQIFVDDFNLVKVPFRSSLMQSISEKKYSDELELLRKSKIPALIIFGEDEMVIDINYLDDLPLPLWGGKVFKIPGGRHLVQIDQPVAFNLLLKEFATDIFK